jgi:mitochondrial fission protein ELM1
VSGAEKPLISLEAGRAAVAGARVWVITDGKMGDLAQCLGVAERLGLVAESRVVKPRAPFALAMPWGPIDPAEAPAKPGSPLAPPFPEIAIASGRRAAPYLRHLKRASRGETLTLFLKDARAGAGIADLVWVPEHDRLRGANVITTLTSPHRISPERLAAAAAQPAPWSEDQRPVLALLIGGESKDFRFTAEDIARLAEGLRAIAAQGYHLVGTPSRRTSADLRAGLVKVIAETGGWFWDGQGENPYLALLAKASSILVTAESVNMAGEAAATGKPVLFFRPTGSSRKIDQFLRGLEAHGAARLFQGRPETLSYEPLDSTPLIARHLASLYRARHKG